MLAVHSTLSHRHRHRLSQRDWLRLDWNFCVSSVHYPQLPLNKFILSCLKSCQGSQQAARLAIPWTSWTKCDKLSESYDAQADFMSPVKESHIKNKVLCILPKADTSSQKWVDIRDSSNIISQITGSLPYLIQVWGRCCQSRSRWIQDSSTHCIIPRRLWALISFLCPFTANTADFFAFILRLNRVNTSVSEVIRLLRCR